MHNELEVKNALSQLSLDQVRTPNLPMPTALQEANDLLTYCMEAHIAPRLIAVGQPVDFAEELGLRIKVARQAQSVWINVRDQTKSQDLVALEEQATRLRSTMIAAGRYNLKARESQATISQIRGGDSVADLVQDLSDLSTLFERNIKAFDSDKSIDAQALASESHVLSEQLSSEVSNERVDAEPAVTRERRDRAFTYMDDFVSELRAAGRYAFRLEPSTSKRFASKYRRRTRGKSRSTASEEAGARPAHDVVEEEVVGEEPFAA